MRQGRVWYYLYRVYLPCVHPEYRFPYRYLIILAGAAVMIANEIIKFPQYKLVSFLALYVTVIFLVQDIECAVKKKHNILFEHFAVRDDGRICIISHLIKNKSREEIVKDSFKALSVIHTMFTGDHWEKLYFKTHCSMIRIVGHNPKAEAVHRPFFCDENKRRMETKTLL